ncbi:MAG TPA: tRNA-uridine aminocarboxypropyltransferase [Telluria sp.]
MIPSPTPRRAQCPVCVRPQSTCICAFITAVTSPVDLLILQHPLEVANAKNSARLLHLSVTGSRLLPGETFSSEQLEALLTAGGRTPVLLYPATSDDSVLVAQAPPLDPALLQSPDKLRLVALDATWRKSRKMLYLNPLLQQLPRLALSNMPASNYRIRKAHAPDQLSTLEAVAYALAQLDGDQARSDTLLATFERFVSQQSAFASGLKSA